MMKAMLNAVRLQVQRAMASLVSSRPGSISSYDPNTMTAVVELQPDGDLTGWLPVASAWIGNGWGMFAPPNIGDLVDVVFINGDLNAGTVEGRFYKQGQALPVESGEFWLVHESGAFFKLLNSGALTISDGQGATVTLNGDGTITSAGTTWNHTGDVNVAGNVTVSETLTATTDVIGGNVSLKTHLTPGVQTGGGVSAAPIPL